MSSLVNIGADPFLRNIPQHRAMRPAIAFLNSTLAPDSVSALVGDAYGVDGACTLHYRGTHDTYRLQHGDEVRFFRIYRAGLRTQDDARYELAVLRHAVARGMAVTPPIARRDGEWLTVIEAPEGARHAVLFTNAPGSAVSGEEATAEHVRAYGRAIASLHVALADMPARTSRSLSEHALLDRPLEWLAPHLQHRPEDQRTLTEVVATLRAHLAGPIVAACPQGVCHGDLHGGNAHYDGHHGITLFDFDECGYGWLAYDLAAFHWMAERAGQLDTWWPLLLDGYEAVRPFTPNEHAAMPIFVLLRHLWQLGYDAWDNRFGGMARADADITAIMHSLREHSTRT